MNDIRLNISDVDFAHDDATREARHELLASFLGAYIDNELPPETRSQLDAHLTGCARCRRELGVQRTLRDRLGNEPVPAATASLRSRIEAGVRNAPPPLLERHDSDETTHEAAPRKSLGLRMAVGALVVLVAATMIAVPLMRSSQNGERVVTAVSSQSVPVFGEVLADYRRVTAGNLPGRARDLDAVRAAVPFRIQPLSNSSLRLLGAWTVSIRGEPAAVLSYRWNDRILLQYFISDELLFQSPEARASLAAEGSATVTDRAEGMLVWAEAEYGTLLVGGFTPEQFAALRDASRKH